MHEQAHRNVVAIRKKLGQFSPHVPASQPSAKHTERKCILHAVFQNAGGRSIRLKNMRVLPVRERTGNLDIGKVAAFFKVPMLRDPLSSKRPSPKLQRNTSAAFDSPGFFNHSDVFPRRRKPLQRLRQGMPQIHLSSRGIDSRAADKCFGFHIPQWQGH